MGEGFGKDLLRLKVSKYKEKLSFYMNTSPLHPHPLAMTFFAHAGVVGMILGEGLGTSGQIVLWSGPREQPRY